MPMFEIIGITSTDLTYSVGFGFVTHEKEENFVWVLQMMHKLLTSKMKRHFTSKMKRKTLDRRNDYVGVYASEDPYNYILNCLLSPTNSGGIALVDKWLTFPDMGHIVANYYNRCVVFLTNHEIGTSESFFSH